MKKSYKTLMCLASLTMLAACGGAGGGHNSHKNNTVIQIYTFGGGVGTQWLTNAAERFAELKKDYSYEEGKTSVYINFTSDTYSTDDISTMASTATQLYFTEKAGVPRNIAQKGTLFCLDELINETNEFDGKKIIDKIDPEYLSILKANDGKVYGLPHYEWYSGLTYDRDAFTSDEFPLYFAGPEASDPATVDTTFGEATFITDAADIELISEKHTLSCGIDGVYGTADDGLPSSIQEFLQLCYYMKETAGVTPLCVTGQHIDYTAYLLQAFLGAFSGADGLHNYYDFNGEMNIITGYDNSQDLFYEGSGIPTPTYQKTTITEKTGYLVRNTVERYYVAQLMKILQDNNFFNNGADSGSYYYNNAHDDFINGGIPGKQKYGFLIEGNYWYNEAVRDNSFDYFNSKWAGQKTRDLGWLPIPSKLSGSVEEGDAPTASTLLDTGYSYMFANANMTTKCSEGVVNAVKDFIKFIYSDSELSAFTSLTGICKAALDYDYYSPEVIGGLSKFQQDVLTIKHNNALIGSKVVLGNGDNETFNGSIDTFLFGINAPIWQYSDTIKTYYAAFKGGKTVDEVFEATKIDQNTWEKVYYKGE